MDERPAEGHFEEASARRSKLSGETLHRPVPRPGYQQGKSKTSYRSMAGSITEKSIINDYAEGPAVTNDPSRRVKPI